MSRVSLKNFHKRELKILLDPKKMYQQSVSLQEVVQAVQDRQNVSAGILHSTERDYFIKVFGEKQIPDDLEDIVIRSNFSGRKIFLKDIATIQDGQEEPQSSVLVQGKPSVILSVIKTETSDSIKTINWVKKTITDYKKKIKYASIDILFDESKTAKKRLTIVKNNAWVGLILVLIILLISLPGRVAMSTTMSLPFSILCTVAIVASMGITFNPITMCAFIICIGMLVDNSVVISEKYIQFQQKPIPTKTAVLEATYEMSKPVLATTLTTVLAFFPMLITQGIMGQFIRWIPITVSIALIVSLLEALFLLPCRLHLTINQYKVKPTNTKLNILKQIEKPFKNILTKVIQKKYLSIGMLVGILLLSGLSNYLGSQFVLFPKENISTYIAYFSMEKGVLPKKIQKASQQLEKKIRSTLGSSNIQYTKVDLSYSNSQGSLHIEIKEPIAQKWNYKIILKKLRAISKTPFKSLRFNVEYHGPRVGRAVQLILFSPNLSQLNQAGLEIHQKLSQIKGLTNITDDREYSGPEYEIQPDHSALSRMGLSTRSVGTVLRTALSGKIAGQLTQNGESFYIRVKYNNQSQTSTSHTKLLNHLWIPAQKGQLIPLHTVVKWKINPKGSEIKKHYAFKSALTFYANINPLETSSATANLKIQKLMQQIIKKYPLLSYQQAGEHETLKKSLHSLFGAMILAIFSIFAVLLIMFNSFSISLLILSSSIFGWVGISQAFLLHNKPLSFFALIGAVGLFGVVINSAIILVSCIEKLKKQQPNKNLTEILVLAVTSRLRPISITTATTVLGLFPTAYGIGGYDSLLVPMTLSLAWGLVSGTFLTLIWIPCGYAIGQQIFKKL